MTHEILLLLRGLNACVALLIMCYAGSGAVLRLRVTRYSLLQQGKVSKGQRNFLGFFNGKVEDITYSKALPQLVAGYRNTPHAPINIALFRCRTFVDFCTLTYDQFVELLKMTNKFSLSLFRPKPKPQVSS